MAEHLRNFRRKQKCDKINLPKVNHKFPENYKQLNTGWVHFDQMR